MPQDQNPASAWSHNMHNESLVDGVGDEDFTNFLDLDNGFDQFSQMDTSGGHSSLETPMGRLAFGHNAIQDSMPQDQDLMQSMGMPQYEQYRVFQQMNNLHQYQVPPTPVSAEMHASKYNARIDNTGNMVFDRQASFTPLVSPAQTPLDNVFNLRDYGMSDVFFSPLTSPAIEAQQANFTSTNTTASPVDLNTDQSAANTPTSVVRKRGRKADTSQRRPARSVKESPAMKPQQKKRQFSLNSLPSEALVASVSKKGHVDRIQGDHNRSNVIASSEDSVSPEPLSESLMRPPPLPSNIGRSPSALRPHTTDQNLPATPAMIMRIPGKPSDSMSQPDVSISRQSQEELEDIALPDAAASTASSADILPHIDLQFKASDDQVTPTLAAKTPKISADSTPRTTAVRIQNNSSESVDKLKRLEAKNASRGSKKRQSVPSATISPALRPRISPSISPLAPATGPGMSNFNAETNALYLASKSNYQNILDGTHLPGVSYPETLAENLSSKRTSHKIAEQGRRNRINVALKEIESLLPASITVGSKKEKTGASSSKDSEEGSPEKAAGSSSGTSKASTVEMAIVYIKTLQAELKHTQEKLKAAEETLAGQDKTLAGSPESSPS